MCCVCVLRVYIEGSLGLCCSLIYINDRTIWMLRFYFYALFLLIFFNEWVGLFLPKQEVNQKQICQDINNGWCLVVKIKMLVTFFFVLFCIFFNFRGEGEIYVILFVEFFWIHSFTDQQRCARCQAAPDRRNNTILLSTRRIAGSKFCEGCLSVCLSLLGGVETQRRVTLPQ